MVTRQAVSAAVQTATDMTGTRGRICAAHCARRLRRPAPLESGAGSASRFGQSYLATGKYMSHGHTILMLQCVFHTTTFVKSVNVALATPQRAGSAGLAPREFWQRQFHSTEIKEQETRVAGSESEPEREEKESKARPIGGLGEEAYWVGNPVAGALYVLHGNVFLRISVGGVREESARIEKTKILARAIVKRL